MSHPEGAVELQLRADNVMALGIDWFWHLPPPAGITKEYQAKIFPYLRTILSSSHLLMQVSAASQ